MSDKIYIALAGLRLTPGSSQIDVHPGEEIELSDQKAKALVNKVKLKESLPEPPDDDEDRLLLIKAAIETVDFDNEDNLTSSGRPKVHVVESIFGGDVSAAEVEEAFEIFESEKEE